MLLLVIAALAFVLSFLSAKFLYQETVKSSAVLALIYTCILLIVSFTAYAWPV